MIKNIGKNTCKNLNGKYCQKLLHHAKKSAASPATKGFTDALKTTLKKAIEKAAEATGDLTGNNISIYC